MCAQASSLLPQILQVDHMEVYFLRDGRWRHGIRDNASSGPSSAVYIKVPAGGMERHYINLIKTLKLKCHKLFRPASFLPVVRRKAHTNDVTMNINNMVQGIKELI